MTPAARLQTSVDLGFHSSGSAVIEAGQAGTLAHLRIGDAVVQSVDITVMTPEEAGAAQDTLTAQVNEAGYPLTANGSQINYPMVLLILVILVVYVTMVYGPIAAWLVGLFPTRIRYASMSLPYHIGNGWFGGFLPTTAFAVVLLTGNIYAGLWYPIIIALITFVIGTFFLPETKDVDITK